MYPNHRLGIPVLKLTWVGDALCGNQIAEHVVAVMGGVTGAAAPRPAAPPRREWPNLRRSTGLSSPPARSARPTP